MDQLPLKKNYKLLNIARILRRNMTRQEKHYTKQGITHDAARTKIFEKYGIHVLRFSNKDIDDNFEGVCYSIDKTINERLKKPS